MQTSRQWMVTHQWMVEGTRQTEWIDRKGLLIWLAFYAGGLGAGLYIVSLFFDSLWGIALGWFIAAVIKGMLNFSDLGKPGRVWRLAFNPRSSWLSRGLLFVFAFAGAGLIQILLSYLAPEASAAVLAFEVLSGICALGVAAYSGFVLKDVKGVPVWSLPVLPLIFLACSILGGLGLLAAVGLFTAPDSLSGITAASRWILVLNILLVAAYLLFPLRKDPAGKLSILYQLKGGLARVFWTGAGLLALALGMLLAFPEAAVAPLILAAAGEVIGCLLITYCLLKSAIYMPLLKREK